MSLAKLVQRANELTQVSEPEPVYNYVKGQGWVPSFGTVVAGVFVTALTVCTTLKSGPTLSSV
jgi:hypothetical protein